jgi:hypothetical protein
MKLRIFWTLMTRRESAFTTVDGRHGYKYKRDRRQTDFPEDMLPSRAYEALYEQFGQLDTGREVSPTKYALIQGHRLVEPLEAVILPAFSAEEVSLFPTEVLNACSRPVVAEAWEDQS